MHDAAAAIVAGDGEAVRAWTYRVVPAMRVPFCPPTPAYLHICRRGRLRHGLSLAQLEAAARGEGADTA